MAQNYFPQGRVGLVRAGQVNLGLAKLDRSSLEYFWINIFFTQNSFGHNIFWAKKFVDTINVIDFI